MNLNICYDKIYIYFGKLCNPIFWTFKAGDQKWAKGAVIFGYQMHSCYVLEISKAGLNFVSTLNFGDELRANRAKK